MLPLSDFPKFTLAHLPTPLEPLDRLRAHLGAGCPRLYIKRDDCTGLALGGNKTRKLEFLIGEARAQGATAVISEGGLQSNHVRQTAAAAAKAGLACHLVLNHAVPITTEIYRSNGNLLLDRLLGATIHRCDAGETRTARSVRVMDALRAKGETPYYIPLGGSNATGALGYAAAMLEMLRQAKEQGIAVDHVVAASSSGGTQAGLILGTALAEVDMAILGIDIDDDPEHALALVRSIAQDAAEKAGLHRTIPSSAFQIVPGYAAPGYGQPNPGMIEAVKMLAQLEGIVLDPVYTGKAMAGLIDLVRKGTFRAEESIVFLHTGGAPGLFAYENYF